MCIFCEIAKRNISSKVIYEDDDVMAFLDVNPVNEGHTLVIPKKHYANVFELDEEIAAKLAKVTVMLAKRIKERLNVDNLNILNNNGEISGQTVLHYHIHLIPRKENDSLKLDFGSSNTKNTLDEVYLKLK